MLANHGSRGIDEFSRFLDSATQVTRLQHMQPLVTRILQQTRARLLGGDTHVPDKVLSVFEPHTEAIRKGKIAKPTEFGKLVTIQESEH
jgi:IS5 family transposase